MSLAIARKSAVLAAALALGVPAIAHAAIDSVPADTELGTPSCPETDKVTNPCNVITRTTGYQAKVGTKRGLMAVKRSGRLVSWTIKLGSPSAKEIAFFKKTYGGDAQASVVVLRLGNKLRARVVAETPAVKLEKYFGKTAEFPLETSIPVKKGYVIGLAVPTWAPALALNLGSDTSWRASRKQGACEDYVAATQGPLNSVPQFYCLYRKVQLTYSARVIPTP